MTGSYCFDFGSCCSYCSRWGYHLSLNLILSYDSCMAGWKGFDFDILGCSCFDYCIDCYSFDFGSSDFDKLDYCSFDCCSLDYCSSGCYILDCHCFDCHNYC